MNEGRCAVGLLHSDAKPRVLPQRTKTSARTKFRSRRRGPKRSPCRAPEPAQPSILRADATSINGYRLTASW
ncbi:hypothetical protein [Pseudaquabacterium terrae]|uniref:hypothetical protein n=1 Tax=Pseudaquabacterium terrae TaxID=2732868 RepID=UPI001564D3B4|nr:hypothetical protein [Aquabacterium terrae]